MLLPRYRWCECRWCQPVVRPITEFLSARDLLAIRLIATCFDEVTDTLLVDLYPCLQPALSTTEPEPEP